MAVALAAALVAGRPGRGRAGAAAAAGQSNRFPQPTESSFDGGFNFCRMAFQTGRRRGSGWSVDYPRADVNLSIRLSELTRTRVSFDGEQRAAALRADAHRPVALPLPVRDDDRAGRPGARRGRSAAAAPVSAEGRLPVGRRLLGQRGVGWLRTGDAPGAAAEEYQLRDLDPSHPIFHTQFPVADIKQIPSINFWGGTGGNTSENGSDSRTPHARAFLDKEGRILVLATHNTDYGDSWEREGDDPDYFYAFSVDGYAFGINVVLDALTALIRESREPR